MKRYQVLWLSLILVACTTKQPAEGIDIFASALFQDVQLAAVFPDSKTFADCTPKSSWQEVLSLYEKSKTASDFNLKQFVEAQFELPHRHTSEVVINSNISLEQHLDGLWKILQREPDEHNTRSSLIPLPKPYIVPGGRFSEIYYWDSYFTMLGLMAQHHEDIVKSMIDNFAFLIDSVGFIPNGNRSYYLSRSQPPFFSLMVKLLEDKDSLVARNYLPVLQKEYDFWMDGQTEISEQKKVSKHVVRMEDGAILNRYFDQKSAPRPEAYKEDYQLAQKAADKNQLYTDLRSAAESGWDFSSRWFQDGINLQTIQTTAYVPVDLNCLLWHLETMIAKGYQQKSNLDLFNQYQAKANARKEAVVKYCYDANHGYFFDYNFNTQQQSASLTLAGAYPLFFKLVDKNIATQMAKVIKDKFLKPGGLVTTLEQTGQQWDAPNGWAPLQWIVYKGLRNYDLNKLAMDIRYRWLLENRKVFKRTGKMVEKYNVMDTTLLAGGGEYPNQDGFGWTNGVYLAMLKDTLK